LNFEGPNLIKVFGRKKSNHLKKIKTFLNTKSKSPYIYIYIYIWLILFLSFEEKDYLDNLSAVTN